MSINMKSLVAVFAAGLLAACDSNDDISVPIRVVHAVADAPSVDVSNGQFPLFSDIDFKQAAYSQRFFGAASFQVNADLPDGSQATVIGPTNVGITENTVMSIIAIGSVTSTTNPIQPLILQNPNTAVAADSTRVQVVHGAASAPNVDIYVTGPTDALAGAMPLAGGDTPFAAFTPQIDVPAGDYRIRVVVTGDTTLTPVFDSGIVTLPGGANLLIVAVDNTVAGSRSADAPPITLLVADGESQFEILDEATPAEVRIVHAVPDANGVDIFVNDPMAIGAPAIGGLDFAETVPADGDSYLPFPAGVVNVLVTGEDAPGFIAIPATDLELEAGRQYTVYASGTLGSGIAPYITLDDDRSVATAARTRIIHLAPSAGPVDIYLTAPMTSISGVDPVFEDVEFGDETGYISLAGGNYEVSIALAGTKTVAIGPAAIAPEAGGVYTAVARDPDSAAPIDMSVSEFGLILLDDDL